MTRPGRRRCPMSILLVFSTVLLILSACDEDPTTGPSTGNIGPDGGTLSFAGGSVTLVFPAGAVSQDVEVTVQATNSFPANSRGVLSTQYDFGPDGIQFGQPVQLTITYEAGNVPAGARENELRLYRVVGTGWEEIAASSVNTSSQAVMGSITNFSVMGILAVRVASVTVSPASAMIQVGGMLQLTATARDVEDNELPERPIMWSSSDPRVAEVDEDGIVTGVATGQATITATSEGESGTATVAVVAQANPALELVASGLSSPVYVTAPPGDAQRIFVVELTGTIKIIKNAVLLETPFLDLQSVVSTGGEQGLFSMAFHPNYAQNGEFFVDYTDSNGDTRVDRYRASSDPDVADAGSVELIITAAQPFSNHNGGQLDFGPDGMLYIALGDGGSGGDPLGNGQDLSTLLGTILRIDVDGGTPFAIPGDNPFVGDPAARDEIWAYGLRNPWRFAFDRETRDLYIADVGQSSLEEVNVQPAASGGGENYGWNIMEGSACFSPSSGCDQTGLVLPTLEYSHTDGCSITGGYVYRGTAIPVLAGHYLYADFCAGWVKSFRFEGGQAVDLRDWSGDLSPGVQVASFGQDAQGKLYIMTLGGSLYRIAPAE